MRGYPRRWIVYDTETIERPVPHRAGSRTLHFRLGCAIMRSTTQLEPRFSGPIHFNECMAFHDWVEVLPLMDVPIWLFAHNHGFDFRILDWAREMARGRYSLYPPAGTEGAGRFKEPLWILDCPPFLVRLFREDGQVLILADLFNWLDFSLFKIGNWCGQAKGNPPHPDASEDDWRIYCQRDVEVTDHALTKLWDWCRSVGMKDWQPTRASGVMTLWRARYARKRVVPPKDQSVLALDRHAYYGGRTECFSLGCLTGPLYQVDVASMYPYVMGANLYPCEVIDEQTCISQPTPGAPTLSQQTTAEVWIDSPERAYPVRCADGTLYCRGKVRTVLCGPELQRAAECGHIAFHGRWVRYRVSRLFADFVRDWWALRLEAKERGDKLSDLLTKVCMNSLYGKFGQMTGSWHTEGDDYPKGAYGSGMHVGLVESEDVDFRIINGSYQIRHRDQPSRDSFVPIAAWTTSYGRVLMDLIRDTAGQNHVHYQATDSLIVDQEGFANLTTAGLVQAGILGLLHLEGTYKCVEIKGLNHVLRDGVITLPNCPRPQAPSPDGLYEQDKWQGCDVAMRTGKVSSVLIERILTRLRQSYSRSSVDAHGRSQPWVISNWDVTPERQRELPLLPHRD